MPVHKLIMQGHFLKVTNLVYDEAVEVETVAKHLADQCQQYTQYGGARPIGVSLIIGGIDPAGTNLVHDRPKWVIHII